MERRCCALTQEGLPCRQAPLHGSEFCFWHDPEHAEEAQKARQVGGKRAQREAAIEGAYNLGDLATPEGIQRLLRIATTDALQIEDKVQRVRALNNIARNAKGLLDTTNDYQQLKLVTRAQKGARRKF